MIDHLGITVSDFDASKAFYDKALAPLGASLIMMVPAEYAGVKVGGYGREKPDFWLHEGKDAGPGRHYAFTARSRADVDAFYKAAMAAGGRENGAPGLRPITTPTIMAPSYSIPTATTSRRCVMGLSEGRDRT